MTQIAILIINYYNYFWMILANTYQIKQYELKLMQMDARSLAHYTSSQKYPQYQNKHIQVNTRNLRVKWSKLMPKQGNQNIKSFILILLYRMFIGNKQQSLRLMFKKHLYDIELDLWSVKGHNLYELSCVQMKRLMVEFFYLLEYLPADSKVDDKLQKYPAIMSILIIFIRKILARLGQTQALDYNSTLPTHQTITNLSLFFQISLSFQQNLYQFKQQDMFIYENACHQCYFGAYQEIKIHHSFGNNSKSLIQKFHTQISRGKNAKAKGFGSHKSTKSFGTQQTQYSLTNKSDKKALVCIGDFKNIPFRTKLKDSTKIASKPNFNSNVYQINIRCVSKVSQKKNDFDLYVTSKGIGCQLFQKPRKESRNMRKDLWISLKRRQKPIKLINKIQSEKSINQFRPNSNLIQTTKTASYFGFKMQGTPSKAVRTQNNTIFSQ